MNFRLYCLHSQQSLLIVAAIMFWLHSNSSVKMEIYFALSPDVLFCPIFFFSLKFWFVLLAFVLDNLLPWPLNTHIMCAIDKTLY